ncbi:MAG TPA: hypothetical protein VGO37_20060 [Steroidobacteraceae bacterium]|nr:hypothetical protein [Steroidobacteraceae bacterium]
MRHLVKCLALLLLLLVAQQGAVVHELSHGWGVGGTDLKVAAGVADTTCALCPAFAQVNTPAFSHSFHIPLLVRTALALSAQPPHALIDTAVPRPRSRGPPVQS